MSFSRFYFWKAFINSLHFKSILVERDFCIHVHLFNAFQIKYANPKISFIILFMILHVYNIWFFTTAWERKLNIHFIKHFVILEKYIFLIRLVYISYRQDKSFFYRRHVFDTFIITERDLNLFLVMHFLWKISLVVISVFASE